jgi:uncharacterized protein (TIGR02270 family)
VESGYYEEVINPEPLLGALALLSPVPQDEPMAERLLRMATDALSECLDDAGVEPSRTALLVGTREPYREEPEFDELSGELLSRLERSLGVRFHPESTILRAGNASAFQALREARALLESGRVESCVVGGVDSYLNVDDLVRFEQTYRLKQEAVAQGFIPGEGAAFLAVAPRTDGLEKWCSEIVGVGLAEEDAETTVLEGGHPTGKGLQRALEAALGDAQLPESCIDFRVSDLNGEEYRGLESMIVLGRFYRTQRESMPIWLPAASVGEIGAASGALLVIVASVGIRRGYAPGGVAMCEASSDTGLRGCCVVRAAEGENESLAALGPVEMSDPAPRVPEMVDEYVEESAFVWGLRDSAVHRPDYSLEDLVELDERIEAHLDGLRIATAGGQGLSETFVWEVAGEAFAAGHLAFGADADRWIDEVLEYCSDSPVLARGLVSGLGWMRGEAALPHIRSLMARPEAMPRRMGIAAASVHRQDPGAMLSVAVTEGDPLLRSRALKAAGELGRIDMLGNCRSCFSVDDVDSQFWAAWSAALLGDPSSESVLRSIAEGGGHFAERACQIVARRMRREDGLAWQKQLAAREEHHRLAILAAGSVGDPALVPWLIEQMSVDEVARPAGESFSFITGIDLAYDDLERDGPEGFEAGPTESPEDEDVDMDADEDLPWPDPELIGEWWSKNGSRFAAGIRHLCGHPISAESTLDVLKTGFQRQRAAAAVERVLLEPGQPLFEVRARGDRQMRALGLGRYPGGAKR